MFVCVCERALPLEVAYLLGDSVQAVAGEAELSQSQDLTDRLGEHAQAIVGQVETLQLGESAERRGRW